MSDPLQPAEGRNRVTLAVLQTLIKHQYPTVLSTRSILVATSPYLELLRELRPLVVQFSFSTTRDQIAAKIEPHASKPSDLLRAMEVLSNNGVLVTGRWQPYIPGTSEAPDQFVRCIANTGCKHLALEHLKLPMERGNMLWNVLSRGSNGNLLQLYEERKAVRDGRELVLPPSIEKLTHTLKVRRIAHGCGMTFGSADNDTQYLSDSECCCAGVDLFPGFANWFKHQLGLAVRRSYPREIRYSSIQREWTPAGSIDRHLNSRSRLSGRSELAGTLQQHILARWNSPKSNGSPAMFFGVLPGQRDADGNVIYRWDPSALGVIQSLAEACGELTQPKTTAHEPAAKPQA